jgi:lysozyme
VKLNQAGIDLIKEFEGCELKPYQDVAGLWTVGVGHLIRKDEHFTELTEEQAEDLLRRDLVEVVTDVKECVKTVINDNQFSALVSFAFNLGASALHNSTLLKKLNAGNIEGAEQEFLRWNKARVNGELVPVSGLTRRREAEAKLFSTPV